MTSPSRRKTPGSGKRGRALAAFDAGYGAGLLARTIGQKKAKEIWFLCRQYDAQAALDMGLVNTVVLVDELQGRGREVGAGDAGS